MATLNPLLYSRQELERYKGNLGPANRFLELFSFDTLYWEDDFIGDQIKYDATAPGTYYNYTNASGTFTLVANTVNGVAQLNTVGTTANDYLGTSLANKAFQAQLNCFIAVRLQLASIADVKAEIGFGDSTDNAGIVNVLATPTFNASDGACWIFDTNDSGNATQWQCCGVKAGTGPTKIEPTLALAATTYETLGIQLKETNAKFYHWDTNGYLTYESAWMALAITAATQLVPVMFIQTRTGAAKTMNVDFIRLWQRRTTA